MKKQKYMGPQITSKKQRIINPSIEKKELI